MDTSGYAPIFYDNMYPFPETDFENTETFLQVMDMYASSDASSDWESSSPPQSPQSPQSPYTPPETPLHLLYCNDYDFVPIKEENPVMLPVDHLYENGFFATPSSYGGYVEPKQQLPSPVVPMEAPQPVLDYASPLEKIEVVLHQKKRGSGGVWQPVVQGERIRVDKSKGKLIKLIVTAPAISSLNLHDKDLSLKIAHVNLSHPDGPLEELDSFTIKPCSDANPHATDARAQQTSEFKLKLTKICKNQCFSVLITSGAQQWSASSIEFRSDDNGKVQSTSKKRKRATQETGDISDFLREGLKRYSDSLSPSLQDNTEFVNLIARTLVPVILDNFQQQLTPPASPKRSRFDLSTPIPIKCETA